MNARQNVDIGTQESVVGFGVAGTQGAQVMDHWGEFVDLSR